MASWAGVDVGARAKAFHLAFVDDARRVVFERTADVVSCVAALRRHGITVVAVDAPSSWAPVGERSRPSERAFARTRLCGIRFTPDELTAAARGDSYYEWIEHGLELWSACRAAGFVTIECFPTASWSAWLGPRPGTSRAGWTRRGISELTRAGVLGLETARSQDERDAVAAALTAYQWEVHRDTTQIHEDLVVPRRNSWPVAPTSRSTRRGRLADGTRAPERGETTTVLASGDRFRVEQILSGILDAPEDYLQDHDEWVVVVEGAAELEVDGETHHLSRGDWCFLPAGVSHRLVRTEPGTSWIAVRSG